MSRYAGTAEAEKVAAAYEDAKKRVLDGQHPTDAVHAAVSSAGLGEQHAETVGHTLNQTIAASVGLDDDPHQDFETADVDDIKKRLKEPRATENVEEATTEEKPAKKTKKGHKAMVSNDFTDHVPPGKPARIEKKASLEFEKVDTRAFKELARKAADRLSEYTEKAARDMDNKVASFCRSYAMAGTAERQQAVCAMLSVDPVAADLVATHVEHAMGVDTAADMDKTASLPQHCSTAAFDGVAAVRAALAYDEALGIQKQAVIEDINSVIEGISGFGGALGSAGGGEIGEQMSPEALLRMRGFKATNELHKAMLLNDEISRYSPHEAVKAYNSVVQMNPDAVNNSFLLQSMMSDRLSRGGVVDPMSLANEQKMSLHGLDKLKTMSEITANAAKAKASLSEVDKRTKGEKTLPTLMAGIDFIGDKAKEAWGGAADSASKGVDLYAKGHANLKKEEESATKTKKDAATRADEAQAAALAIDEKELASTAKFLDQTIINHTANPDALFAEQVNLSTDAANKALTPAKRLAAAKRYKEIERQLKAYGADNVEQEANIGKYTNSLNAAVRDPEIIRLVALSDKDGFEGVNEAVRLARANGLDDYAFAIRALGRLKAVSDQLDPSKVVP